MQGNYAKKKAEAYSIQAMKLLSTSMEEEKYLAEDVEAAERAERELCDKDKQNPAKKSVEEVEEPAAKNLKLDELLD